MLKIHRILLTAICTLSTGLSLAPIAYAKPVVVMQYYGMSSCSTDAPAQQAIKDVVFNEENIILLSCPQTLYGYSSEGNNKDTTPNFCFYEGRRYLDAFNNPYSKSAHLFVNGRWEANRTAPLPAVNLGRLDNIQEIPFTLTPDYHLKINVPQLESPKNKVLMLYIYEPTRDSEKFLVDADTELTEEMRLKLYANQSVPFVSKTRTQPLQLRPLVAQTEIYEGTASGFQFEFPINFSELLIKDNIEKLSYVLLVHEGSRFGPILAAGEKMSVEEKNYTFPKSTPLAIEYMSEVKWAPDMPQE